MTLTTISSRAAAALVAAVAGFASYRHIYDVATAAGEHVSVAAVLPLAIDGLILVATLAMLDDKRNQRRPRLSARVALVFGVLATLASNIASAQPTVTARLVAAVPAVSFLLAVEVLARSGRGVAVEPVATVDTPGTAPVTADVTAPVAVVDVDQAVKPRVSRPRAKTLTAAAKVAKVAAKMPAATAAAVAAKAGVSESTARRYMPAPETTVEAVTVPSPTGQAPAEMALNGSSV